MQLRSKKVADFMGEHPDYKVVLAGHTDSVGAEAYNQKNYLKKEQKQWLRFLLVTA